MFYSVDSSSDMVMSGIDISTTTTAETVVDDSTSGMMTVDVGTQTLSLEGRK